MTTLYVLCFMAMHVSSLDPARYLFESVVSSVLWFAVGALSMHVVHVHHHHRHSHRKGRR